MEKRDIPKFTLDDVAAVLESISKFDGKIATLIVVCGGLFILALYIWSIDRNNLWAI